MLITADGNYSTISLVDGSEYVVTLQLCRIGKSLIINREYISYINPARQKLTLSDCRTFKREATASRDALKALKEYIEKEERL